MILAVIVIIIHYFEIGYFYFIIKLLGGFLIRIWVLPLSLAFLVLMKKFTLGRLNIPMKNIKSLNYFLAFYIFFGFLSMIINELTLYQMMQSALIMFLPLLLYIVIIEIFRENSDIERVLKIFFVIGLFLSIYTIIIFKFLNIDLLHLEPVETRTGIKDPSEQATFSSAGEEIVRPTLLGLSQDKFGGILSPLVILGLYYTINSSGLLKYFYFASSSVIFIAIIQTMSRGAISALIVGIISFLYCIRKQIFVNRKILIIIIIVIFVMIFTTNNYVISRFIVLLDSIGMFQDSQILKNIKWKYDIMSHGYDPHVESVKYAFYLTRDSFIFGYGIPYIEDHYRFMRGIAEHNRYLYILLTAGIFTSISYIGFIIVLIFLTRKMLIKKTNYKLINDIGLVLYPVCILFMVKLFNEGLEAHYYWIFFGFVSAWIRNKAYERGIENTHY